MPVIELTTVISAPVERVFDLARSIDAHTRSASHTHEKAVAGRTAGLMEKGETVTWEARHFGFKQRLTVSMTRLERPECFEDEMVRGLFASMKHQHRFQAQGDQTVMTDHFDFQVPLGWLGRLAEILFLTRYMKAFLIRRNRELKQMAESDAWQRVLPQA